MNNKEFQEILIQRTGLQTQEVEALSSVLIDSIVSALAADNCVTIHGFGSFETKEKGGRKIYNPSSKIYMEVPPKMTISYKMSAALKDKLNAQD